MRRLVNRDRNVILSEAKDPTLWVVLNVVKDLIDLRDSGRVPSKDSGRLKESPERSEGSHLRDRIRFCSFFSAKVRGTWTFSPVAGSSPVWYIQVETVIGVGVKI